MTARFPLEKYYSRKVFIPDEDVVRKQLVPKVPGEPIPMYHLEIDEKVPRSMGNPWVGAYSKHGFWYKFTKMTFDDFQYVVAYSIDTDNWTLQYKDFELWSEAFGDDMEIVVCRGQRMHCKDVTGCIAFAKYGDKQGFIGLYWLMEEYRHSNIGPALWKYAMKKLKGRNIGCFGIQYLTEKIRAKHGFKFMHDWDLIQIIVDKPLGYENLNCDPGILIVEATDTRVDQKKLEAYDQRVSGGQLEGKRGKYLYHMLRHPDGDSRIAVTQRGEICGLAAVREVAGGEVKRLVVGPFYANDIRIARALLYELLAKYNDPEEVETWNPNPWSLIHREISFWTLSNNPLIREVCRMLKGEEGDVLTHGRYTYKAQFTKELVRADEMKVLCIADWHVAPV